MTNTVKLFRCSDGGAPTLTGQAGSLIALLDACLVNGYNVKAPSSITRNGNTATITYAAAHGYQDKQTVLISGATEPEYNGEFRIGNVSTLSFDITVTGTPATPATGTPASKTAPLGFTKPFSGTNKAVYRSSEPTSTGHYLRIDDTGTVYATPAARAAAAAMFETMTDVDTGTKRVPTAASAYANNVPWHKSLTADATQRPWLLVGDGELFYLSIVASPNLSECFTHVFGNIVTYKPGDAGHCILGYGRNDTTNLNGSYDYAGFFNCNNTRDSAYNWGYLASAYNQITLAAAVKPLGDLTFCALGDAGISFPNPVDNGLYWSGFRAMESTILRGRIPGVYHPLHAYPIPHAGSLSSMGTILEDCGVNGGDFLSINVSTDQGGVHAIGQLFFDITGPWR